MESIEFKTDEQPQHLSHSRKLMSYHCSGSDTVLGDVNVGGSVVILLLIGFVVGFGLAWFIFWRRQRKQMLLELEYRDRFPEGKKEAPDISPIVQSATAPVAPTPASSFRADPKLPQTAAALASGPLALGVRDSSAVALPTKQPPQRTGSGNPFVGVEPYNVVRNPTSSLDSSLDGPLARSFARANSSGVELRSSGGGLIPAAPAAPAASQSFARRTTTEQGQVAGAGATAAAGLAAEPVHARSETMVVNPLAASAASDYAAAVARTGAGASAERPLVAEGNASADYAAAVGRTSSGNPFVQDKQAQKQELLGQVRSDEYEEGDLDPEWLALLQELDARLLGAGKAALSSKERAVAIRSLIVATASQSADVALGKALQDVDTYRKAQLYRAG